MDPNSNRTSEDLLVDSKIYIAKNTILIITNGLIVYFIRLSTNKYNNRRISIIFSNHITPSLYEKSQGMKKSNDAYISEYAITAAKQNSVGKEIHRMTIDHNNHQS
jgi:hypothetical protein